MIASFYEGDHNFSVQEKTIAAPAKGEVQIKVAYYDG